MQNLKKQLKAVLRFTLDVFLLCYGLLYYYFNKRRPLNERTPPSSHLGMIRLFCQTSGWSNDFISKCISLIDKPIKLENTKGILGDLSSHRLKEINQSLEMNGFCTFEKVLPPDSITKLYHFALTQECTLRPLDEENIFEAGKRGFYNRENPLSSVYDIPFETFASNSDIQALLRDNSFIAIAQEYLKTSAKVDYGAFWWSTAYSSRAQSNSAQMYHFDMDRFKWLKVFIFLTDVTLENGPHVFVRQTHQSHTIPKSLLKAGYTRHEDFEVEKHFPKEDVKIFTVPAGTIHIEDTRGLHKGTCVQKGERLVLELQYSNCLFGAVSPSIKNAKIQDEKLLAYAKQYPKIFKLYPV